MRLVLVFLVYLILTADLHTQICSTSNHVTALQLDESLYLSEAIWSKINDFTSNLTEDNQNHKRLQEFVDRLHRLNVDNMFS